MSEVLTLAFRMCKRCATVLVFMLMAAAVLGSGACAKSSGDTVPEISDVSVAGITSTSASIHWATNKPATSQVKYGLSSSYGIETTPVSELVDTHIVVVSGLEPSTTYHCQAVSVDESGSLSTSSDYSFDTLPKGTGLENTTSTSQITDNPSMYDGQIIELSGQILATAGGSNVILDGRGAMNLAGDIGDLGTGFYRLQGVYDAATNTLTVLSQTVMSPGYSSIQDAESLGLDLVPVSIQGLIATVPKEVTTELASYYPSFLSPPDNMPMYAYVVFTGQGLYLVLSDHEDMLDTEFTLTYDGTTYSLSFCAGEVRGTLIRTPLDSIPIGPGWTPGELGGVIIAESLSSSDPLHASVADVVGSPSAYAFKRVSIDGSYLVSTGRVDYAGINVPFGIGVLADSWTAFFEDGAPRLKTIDPERRSWQMRDAEIVGTVVCPTEQILTFLDYSLPLTKEQVLEVTKPVLVVGDIRQSPEAASISDITGNRSQYWGKVVEFDAYALGVNYSLKAVASTITKVDIPVDVNLLALVAADSPAIGSQIVIVGLNSDLIDGQGELILGKYKFTVAVAQVPQELIDGSPLPDTALFLLSKEELPISVSPPQFYSLTASVAASGTGTVALSPLGGSYPSGLPVQLVALPLPGYAFDYWSGDASGTSMATSITMDSDKNVVAHFKEITYSLSVSIDQAGWGTVAPPNGPYLAGTVVPLVATPLPGYDFDYWSGDASGTSMATSITMDSDKTIVAHFKEITYSLSVSIDQAGWGTVAPPNGPYLAGTVVPLVATPLPRYDFDYWSGDASGTSMATSITMDSDKTIVAHFKEITYSLSVSIDQPGWGTVAPPNGPYLAGTVVPLVATPLPGYDFDYWSGDASGTSMATSITMDSDKTVVAHFKEITYSLSVSIDQPGWGTVAPPNGPYLAGTVVPLVATPLPGYDFDYWSGDASGTSMATSITMDSDKTVVAHFKEITYSLTIVVVSGSGTVVPGGGSYLAGTAVPLLATPGPFYDFDYWSGDASGTSMATSITMDSDKVVYAYFKSLF